MPARYMVNGKLIECFEPVWPEDMRLGQLDRGEAHRLALLDAEDETRENLEAAEFKFDHIRWRI